MPNKRAQSDARTLPAGSRAKGVTPQGVRGNRVPSQRKAPPPSSSNAHRRLPARLRIAEETLQAIQAGEVDALIVSSLRGERVVSLRGGEPNYRMLVEAMSEGAATLSRNGDVLYCNGRVAELIGGTPGRPIGIPLQSLIAETERDRFEALLTVARKGVAKGEFSLRRSDGNLVPVYLSLNRLRGFKGQALGMVITDLSGQKHRQAEEIKQAEAMHRLLLERTLSAQEEERRRIARELHDEAGQLLTALLVGLRTLEDAQKLADVKAQGQRLRDIAAQAIDQLGRLARGLHPTVLDDHGLGVALRRYASEFTRSYGIAVNVALKEFDSSTLPPTVQIALYRILQEALTNVARHSGAKTVEIRFARSAAGIEVAVIDDGCGFDAKAVAASSQRLGIQSMRERAALLGGTVRFVSQRRGARMQVQIPIGKGSFRPAAGEGSA